MNVDADWAAFIPEDAPDGERSDLALAARAALAGGVAARSWYGTDLDVERKGAGDPVTAADHAANDAILGCLAKGAPGDAVRSEESPPMPGGAGPLERLWIVDPLDGTKEFIARNGEFAVMVGLSVGGRALLGAVLQPDPGRLYVGVTDRGAWSADVTWGRNGARTTVGAFERVTVSAEREGRLRMVHSRSHPDPLIAEIGRRVDASSVRSGSVGVKCALIAQGAADLYVHPVPFLKEWDTCAPEAILRGAGGRVSDCGGGPLSYGKLEPRQPWGIFAGRAAVWQSTLPLVREVTAAKLRLDP